MADKKRTGAVDWEDVRYFVALTRHGTLAATARALRVNHATVSRRMAHLEASLGQALFDRRADGYILTAAGKAVLDEASAMEHAAATIPRRLDAEVTVSGLVRVTATRTLADGFLVERLGGLFSKYPELDLEIVGESRNLSLARHEADLALRLGRPVKGELITRRLATLDYGFYGSQTYLDRLRAGATPAFIGFDHESEYIPEAAWAERALAGKRVVMRSNSQLSQAAAARSGFGVTLLPRLLAQSMADLVSVDMEVKPPSRELWLLMRPDVARIPRVRIVADYLVQMFCKKPRPPARL